MRKDNIVLLVDRFAKGNTLYDVTIADKIERFRTLKEVSTICRLSFEIADSHSSAASNREMS